MFGITDHVCGIGYGSYEAYEYGEVPSNDEYQRRIDEYRNAIGALQEKYKAQIQILLGIEIAMTQFNPRSHLPNGIDVSEFDYCLLEHLSSEIA